MRLDGRPAWHPRSRFSCLTSFAQRRGAPAPATRAAAVGGEAHPRACGRVCNRSPPPSAIRLAAEGPLARSNLLPPPLEDGPETGGKGHYGGSSRQRRRLLASRGTTPSGTRPPPARRCGARGFLPAVPPSSDEHKYRGEPAPRPPRRRTLAPTLRRHLRRDPPGSCGSPAAALLLRTHQHSLCGAATPPLSLFGRAPPGGGGTPSTRRPPAGALPMLPVGSTMWGCWGSCGAPPPTPGVRIVPAAAAAVAVAVAVVTWSCGAMALPLAADVAVRPATAMVTAAAADHSLSVPDGRPDRGPLPHPPLVAVPSAPGSV